MTNRGTKIHIGMKRYHAARRQELHDALSGVSEYQPLNPETFGKPAPAKLPFTPERKPTRDDKQQEGA